MRPINAHFVHKRKLWLPESLGLTMNLVSVCYLSLTAAVCGHIHKSDGLSPVQKKKQHAVQI